jgi:hypothetical protein
MIPSRQGLAYGGPIPGQGNIPNASYQCNSRSEEVQSDGARSSETDFKKVAVGKSACGSELAAL